MDLSAFHWAGGRRRRSRAAAGRVVERERGGSGGGNGGGCGERLDWERECQAAEWRSPLSRSQLLPSSPGLLLLQFPRQSALPSVATGYWAFVPAAFLPRRGSTVVAGLPSLAAAPAVRLLGPRCRTPSPTCSLQGPGQSSFSPPCSLWVSCGFCRFELEAFTVCHRKNR